MRDCYHYIMLLYYYWCNYIALSLFYLFNMRFNHACLFFNFFMLLLLLRLTLSYCRYILIYLFFRMVHSKACASETAAGISAAGETAPGISGGGETAHVISAAGKAAPVIASGKAAPVIASAGEAAPVIASAGKAAPLIIAAWGR
jgi:hypothetical protein